MNQRMPRLLSIKMTTVILSGCFAFAQSSGGASEAPRFDVQAAVNAYLASVPADARARSDAYFEGGYWLLLWDFLYVSAVMVLLLGTRISAAMRDAAERLTRFKPLQVVGYWTQLLTATSVLTLPLTIYEGFLRERQYGLMNQTFSAWFEDYGKALLVNLVLGSLVVPLLFGVVRRLPRTWWLWGAAVAIMFTIFSALITPVYIAPLFNKYTPLQDERIRQPILSMARANGISANDVWQVDASRQSKRISANVSGFLGTERITLNDNLLNRCTLPEIESVMGHEMGHYVMHHVYAGIVLSGIGYVIFFAFLRWSVRGSLSRWGAKWDLRDAGDTAVLPLMVLLGSIFLFLTTPVTNSVMRVQEYEADIFGLNAARQPDADARVDVMLGEYRKLDPTRLEEILFFDHPSGRTRITAAMRWKAEHLAELQDSGEKSLPLSRKEHQE